MMATAITRLTSSPNSLCPTRSFNHVPENYHELFQLSSIGACRSVDETVNVNLIDVNGDESYTTSKRKAFDNAKDLETYFDMAAETYLVRFM